jgi:hypothetical protein
MEEFKVCVLENLMKDATECFLLKYLKTLSKWEDGINIAQNTGKYVGVGGQA